ncbi:hypothetical protein [Streptococcus plurextorum]|uniref:hypothetical protein n=1 Tax=Streptococcus plurextorum TaxID=456876 RepID=UPI0003F7C2A8|nr:hypothetical protein [Streptococcus plurextorum]
MITEKDYNSISEDVYQVDSGKTLNIIKLGDTVVNGQYRVLAVEDNTANGIQAMAVAPVVDGKVDTTQITIAYAGTNFGDGKDRQTDVSSVILGLNIYP